MEISSSERDDDDILSKVVKKQEAALRKLEEKHGSGYGKPPAGSKSEARAKRYNENCVREIIELCAIISERGTPDEQGRKTILFEKIFNAYRYKYQISCLVDKMLNNIVGKQKFIGLT